MPGAVAPARPLPDPAPRPGRTEVVAHRGASAEAPENTLVAFARALELGADWFELDACRCGSGELVVIHDDTLERTTDGRGPVAARSLAELRALDAGAWKHPRFRGERIPTLREALDLARGRIGVYLEVKPCASGAVEEQAARQGPALRAALLEAARDSLGRTPELDLRLSRVLAASESPEPALARTAIAEVRAAAMERQVVLQSFSPVICLTALLEAPALRVELLVWDEPRRPEVWEEYLRWAYLLGVPGVNPPLEAVSPGRLAALRAAGKTSAVWTVDEEPDLRRLAGWGVERLITNRPDLALRVLGRSPGR